VVVLSVKVSAASVQYEVAWFETGSRQVEWVEEFELDDAVESELIKIGFHAKGETHVENNLAVSGGHSLDDRQ
jgi:hypothetical protein